MHQHTCKLPTFLVFIAFACWINARATEAFSTFGFDIHHRYSDTVREYLDTDGLPEQGTLDYYAAMAHRDQLFKARRLAGTTPPGSLTFEGTNQTLRISLLGFLHYAFVTVGTPSSTYLVALDTGSDLFWLPCDCKTCMRTLNTTSGRPLSLNIYSPSTSSTSSSVPCTSTLCGPTRACSTRFNACAYQEVYLSANTSSTGILINDVLHMGTNSNPQSLTDVPITLGCGMVQTGDFVANAAINGLFGLGMNSISVPSILASKGLTADSFSMCFGRNGLGRINFGDKGSPDQEVTPFNLVASHPTYNITVTQISVGDNITNVEFTAIFDSGTSFTYLNNPAYSVITDSFNSQITNEPPYQPKEKVIFNHCYALSATQESYRVPRLNFTMKGGSQFSVLTPTVLIPREDGGYAYCLAMVKSEDINIIGQNFMAGYRLVFDREEMVLGWKQSDCNNETSTTPSDGSNNLPVNNGSPTPADAPTPSVFDPQATVDSSPPPRVPRVLRSPPPQPTFSLLESGATRSLNYMCTGPLMLIISIYLYQFIIISS